MMKNKKGRMAGDRMSFGAGNITGPGAERRQPEKVNLGDAMSQGQMMPQDLSAGYLNLAIPNSPLGAHALMASSNLRHSQAAQDMMTAAYQQQVMPMQMRGQLPVGMMPQQQQQGWSMAKDKSPKKAVKKAKKAQEIMQEAALQAALQAEMMQQGASVDPEIQSQQITMQVPTVNPYGRMGAMPPNQYNTDNSVNGYIGVQPFYNPEA